MSKFPATAFLDDIDMGTIEHMWMNWKLEYRDPTVNDEGPHHGKIWMNQDSGACFMFAGERDNSPGNYRWCYIAEIENGRCKITKDVE